MLVLVDMARICRMTADCKMESADTVLTLHTTTVEPSMRGMARMLRTTVRWAGT